MSTLQQVQVIIIALAFTSYVLYKVRVAKLDLRYAITWLIVAAGMLGIAAFPHMILQLAFFLGFEAGTTMVFIATSAVLAIIVFRQTIVLSNLEKRVVALTQVIAVMQHEQEGRNSEKLDREITGTDRDE